MVARERLADSVYLSVSNHLLNFMSSWLTGDKLLSTCSNSPRFLPCSLSLLHQFLFHTLWEGYQLDITGAKIGSKSYRNHLIHIRRRQRYICQRVLIPATWAECLRHLTNLSPSPSPAASTAENYSLSSPRTPTASQNPAPARSGAPSPFER